MPKRRLHPRLFAPAHTLVVWVLLVVGSSLLPDAARAEPLDGVTGTVNEATAPVTEAVEQVVPPVAAPSPTAQAPAAELPEVEVPNLPVEPAPVRLPKASAQPPSVPKVSETATKAVEAATDMATGTAGAVTSTGNGVVETTQGSAEEARETTLQTVESAAAGVERTANAPPTTASAGPAGPRETPDGSSAENAPPLRTAGGGATAAPSDFSSMVFPGFPARLLHPFIRVWPAVALLAESSLGSFVGRWSQSVLVLFEEEGV
ncbi:MAG TPA: hypothetical protein VEB65_06215, partial [Solirubrobacterales bacterium]|nr:hypothetical protein [Solirubrobacterales bacterium]